jgi:hypothetical protein
MAGIIFYYEEPDVDVWSGKNLDAWNYALQIAGDFTNIIIINKTDQILQTPNGAFNFQVINDISELNVEGTVCRLACPWEDLEMTSLWDFNHNTDWYIIGPASGWNQVAPEHKNFDMNVCLPQNGKFATHSVHVFTVVAFDRYNKLNK